jgi:hypothetical protein
VAGSRTLIGRKTTRLKKPKTALLTPMPMASINIAATVKPGALRSMRAA